MSVAKVIEISAESGSSFDDALKQGIREAGKSVKNIKSVWIKDQEVVVANDAIETYRVHLKVTFVVGG